MSEKRNAKKTKVAESEEKDLDDQQYLQTFQKLEEIQYEIEKLNSEAADKVLEIEMQYNKKRHPLHKKRNQIASSIPKFWLKAFMNHPTLGSLLEEEDQKVFEYLTEVEVEDSEDVKSGYKITFTFAPNPYFENTKLWKDIRYDGAFKVTSSEIKWKEGKDLTKTPPSKPETSSSGKRKRGDDDDDDDALENSQDSFFCWFNPEDQDVEIAELIRDEFWQDPVKFFQNTSEDDDDDDEDDAGKEGQGEANDEEDQ